MLQPGIGAKLRKQPGDSGVEFPLAVIPAKNQQMHQTGNKGQQPNPGLIAAPHPPGCRDSLSNVNENGIREINRAPQEGCFLFVLLPPLLPVEHCRD
jgi:hypothetical protein